MKFSSIETNILSNLLADRAIFLRKNISNGNDFHKQKEQCLNLLIQLNSSLENSKIDESDKMIISSCLRAEENKFEDFKSSIWHFKNPINFIVYLKDKETKINYLNNLNSIRTKINKERNSVFLQDFNETCKYISEYEEIGIELDDFTRDRVDCLVFFKKNTTQLLKFHLTKEFDYGSFKFIKTDSNYIKLRKSNMEHVCNSNELLSALKQYPLTNYSDGMFDFISYLIK